LTVSAAVAPLNRAAADSKRKLNFIIMVIVCWFDLLKRLCGLRVCILWGFRWMMPICWRGLDQDPLEFDFDKLGNTLWLQDPPIARSHWTQSNVQLFYYR
jgi:hypothetical protein